MIKKELKSCQIKESSSRKVVVRDISCFAIPRTETLRGDDMASRAFTLIELLVVVLIIGILAAVALPQYERAVANSHIMQAVISSKVIWDAEQEYFLATGTYTNNGQDLSLNYPCIDEGCTTLRPQKGSSCVLSIGNSDSRVNCMTKNFISFQRFLSKDKITCCSYETTNYIADNFCIRETGSSIGHNWCGTESPCKCYENK